MRKTYEQLARVEVKEKTGFRNLNGKPIILLDESGVLFYDTRELSHIVWEFNLPAGIYYIVQGKFTKKPSPVQYEMAKMPKPERWKKSDPENFDVKFLENPFTGSVFWDVRNIYLDNSLSDLPIPCLVFVLYHEYGHRFFKTEEYCDIYARNKMLDAGYNPSQIGDSIIHTLSAKQYPRMLNVIESLI